MMKKKKGMKKQFIGKNLKTFLPRQPAPGCYGRGMAVVRSRAMQALHCLSFRWIQGYDVQ